MHRSPHDAARAAVTRLAAIATVAIFTIYQTPIAQAQSSEPPMNPKDTVEAPPRPEPPYPGSDDIDLTPNTPVKRANPLSGPSGNSSSAPVGSSAPAAESGTWAGHLNKSNSTANPSAATVERPKRIDEEGNYFYDRSVPQPTGATTQPGVFRPKQSTADGEYLYDLNDKSTEPAKNPAPGLERPQYISKDGEYKYKLPGQKNKKPRGASVRIGVMTPPTIVNADHPNVDFGVVYGKGAQPVVLAEYEWRSATPFGQVGAQITSGIFNASGKGQFVTPRPEGTTPLESFTFLMFPNELNLFYKFRYADKQIIVPYVTGGVDYFTFVELRDDNKPAKFGGALGVGGAGGLNFLLDRLDPRAIQQLNNEYGIRHVYISLEVRAVFGLSQSANITSQVYNAGINLEF